LFRATKIHR